MLAVEAKARAVLVVPAAAKAKAKADLARGNPVLVEPFQPDLVSKGQ